MKNINFTYGLKNDSTAVSYIFPVLILVSLFLLLSYPCYSQTKNQGNVDPVVTVSGKRMSAMDSTMVKDVFFNALRQKTIQNPGLAAELFNRVIQIDPLNDASLYELAVINKDKNNYAEAQQLLERAVKVNKDNEWYWVALADCYEKNNDINKLENVFTELIRINPDKPDYYFDEANAYFIQKRYDEALKIYDQVEQLTGPSDDVLADRQKVYLKQGKVDLAAQQLQQMINSNPLQIKYYLFLSQLYNANNLVDKALRILQNAEKINSNSGLVHLALADIYRDKKNYQASFDQLKLAFAIPDVDIDQKVRIVLAYLPQFPDPNAKASALELSKILTATYPGDAKAFAVYGDMLMQNEKLKEAKEAYKKSISLNNQIYVVQEQLVRIELGDNDADSAVGDGENSLSLFPNQAPMNYLVGIAWQMKKEYNKAISYIKNGASLEAQDKDFLSQSFSSLGDCYHDLKDFKNSDEAYEKALTYNPDNVFTLNNYAYYLSLRGEQLEKAAKMSRRSNDLQPGNASFEDTYAWILFKQKNYSEAKLWIEKALTDDKNSSGVKSEHYGDIMFYLGNTDAAIESWKKAKANGDSSPVLERKINERKYIE